MVETSLNESAGLDIPTGEEITKQVLGWIDDVMKGRLQVGRWLKMAVVRYKKDIQRCRRKNSRWIFDEQSAIDAIQFFPTFLVHTKGVQFAGKPFHLSPLQMFIVWQLFGFRDRETGYRRFTKLFVTVARKWGKSTFVAGLAIYLFYFAYPIEPGAEILCAATKEEQASIVHKQAVHMIEKSPSLYEPAQVWQNADRYKSVELAGAPWNGSVFKPVGSDSKKSDGWNANVIIKDELHAWQKRLHTGLKDRLETCQGARANPLDITISTNGDELSYFFNEDLADAQRTLELASQGNHDNDRLLAIVCMLDEKRPCPCHGKKPRCRKCRCTRCKKGKLEDGSACKCDSKPTGVIAEDDIFEESNWVKANPDIGIAPTWDYMREQAARAKRQPSFKSAFRRYHCNLQTSNRVKLISNEAWGRCPIRQMDWKDAEAVCGAFDIGIRDDLAAVVTAGRFPPHPNRPKRPRYAFKCQSYCPDTANRNLLEDPFPTWVEDGWLIATHGSAVDFDAIRAQIVQFATELGCPQWRFDPFNAHQLGQQLVNDEGLQAVEFRQTAQNYNEPLREFQRAVAEGEIIHDGNPILTWAIGHAIGRSGRDDRIMPDRDKSTEKIDIFVAVIMAFSGVMLGMNPESTYQPGDYYLDNKLEIG